jgi:hypothetical protein
MTAPAARSAIVEAEEVCEGELFIRSVIRMSNRGRPDGIGKRRDFDRR